MRTALYLFVAISEGDIAWMAEAGTVRLFTPGATLIRRGESLDALLILLEGEVQVGAGPGMPAPIRRAGECLGEVSLVDTRPASTDVAAVGPVRALWLNGDTLRRRLDADNGFAARFWRGIAILLANRLREAVTGDPDGLTLDDTMLDGMARAGEKFLLLLDHTRDAGGGETG
jgi:CRP/FNR family transcriptional regulator, cyclic AMP receptor protein